MAESKVIFSLDGNDLTIQCSSMDKMKDICQKYALQLDKNIDSFLFLYGENQVNFDLSFKDQINSLDKENNHMKIVVQHNDNEKYNSLTNLTNNKIIEIESVYFFQKILSYIEEKLKFKLIRYNIKNYKRKII